MMLSHVEYIHEMTQRPMWLLDGDRLIQPSPPDAFVIQRYSDGEVCNIKFPNNVRYPSSFPGIIITPDGVHVTPNLTVWLEPMVTPYMDHVRVSTEDSTDHIEPHQLTLGRNPLEYEREITLPSDSATYDIYGVTDSSKLKPRCLELPMHLDTEVTSNSFMENQPSVGLNRKQRSTYGGGDDDDTNSTNKHVYLSRRGAEGALIDAAATVEDAVRKGTSALGEVVNEGMDVLAKGINVVGETTRPIVDLLTSVLPDNTATKMELDDEKGAAAALPKVNDADPKTVLAEARKAGVISEAVETVLNISAQLQEEEEEAKRRKLQNAMADINANTPPASPTTKDSFFREE